MAFKLQRRKIVKVYMYHRISYVLDIVDVLITPNSYLDKVSVTQN